MSARELAPGLTVRDATADDRARWPGCDRVLSDHNSDVPMWPGEEEEEAALEWVEATSDRLLRGEP